MHKGRNVIGIDLGGTKVAAALVSPRGKILLERKVPTQLKFGWKGLKAQLVTLCRELNREPGGAAAVGVGSAGPLHAPSGTLLDPTNFGWKSSKAVPLSRELSRTLRLPVALENDAAAAALAEQWMGKAKDNCAVLTLGTGLGLGVICDGQLVRGGRGLHPEGGHVVLRSGDKTALCGCGVKGCAEAFLSGKHFARRAGIPSEEAARRARAGDPEAKALFTEYSELLAEYLLDLVVLYYPEEVVLTGSFAEAHDLFAAQASKRLRELLARRLKTLPLLPKLRQSRLGNQAGVLGAALLALRVTRRI